MQVKDLLDRGILSREAEGDSHTDTRLLKKDFDALLTYVKSQSSVRDVKEKYFAFGVGEIFVVGAFIIVYGESNITKTVWAIGGDLPFAMFDSEKLDSPIRVLLHYVEKFREWSVVVSSGPQDPEIINVELIDAVRWSEQLRRKLHMLETTVVPHFQQLGKY